MQCQCGSDTNSSRLVKSKLHAVLEFNACAKCGLLSMASLSIRGLQVSQDLPGMPVARRQFDALNAEQADRLHATAAIMHAEMSGGADDSPLSLQNSLF